MERRDFIRICATTAALATTQQGFAAKDLKPQFYARTQLVDQRRRPIKATSLTAGQNYIFHYPFEATPCFLLNLGKPTVQKVKLKAENGGIYEWPGGVGPNSTIVGYSAICAHRMSYPTRQISFISYRDRSTASPTTRPNMIHCCSEHSEYDPASGAKVISGPAPQPLSAILLEHDRKTDALYAIGTLGGEMFNAFFSKFEFKLALDYGADRVRNQVDGQSVVVSLESFCKQQVKC